MEEAENAYFYINKTDLDTFKDVCTTCLSRGRTLYYTVQHQRSVLLTLGIQVENDQKLCWECCAIVKNIIRFQYKALYAKIIYKSQNLRQLNNVGSMSRLKKTKPFRLCTILKQESCYDPPEQSGKNRPAVEKLYNSRWKVLPEASKIKCQTIIASELYEPESPIMKSQLETTLELARPAKSDVPAVHYKIPRIEFISCDTLNKEALSKKQDVATNNTRERLLLFDKKITNCYPNKKRKKLKLVLKSNQINFTDLKLNAREEKTFPIVSETSSNVLQKNNSEEIMVAQDLPETHCEVDNSKLMYELCTEELQRSKDSMTNQDVGIKHNTYDNLTILDDTVNNTKTLTMNTDENTPQEEPTVELHTVDKELKNNCLTEVDDNAALLFNDMTITEIDDSNSVTETDEDKYVTKADETLHIEDNHISDIRDDIYVSVIISAENFTKTCDDNILEGMVNIAKITEDANLTLTDNVTDVKKCVTTIDYTENDTDFYENNNTLSNKNQTCEGSNLKSMDNIEKNIEDQNVTLTDNVADVNEFVTMIDLTENNTVVYENTNTFTKKNVTCEDNILKGMGNIEKNIEDKNVTLTDNVADVNTFVTMIDLTENNTDVYKNTNTLSKKNETCEDSILKGMDNIEKNTEDANLTLTDNVTDVNKFVTMIDYAENDTDFYENTNTLSNKNQTCEDSILKSMDNIEKILEYENVTITDNVADVNKFVTMIDLTENNTVEYKNTNTLSNKNQTCEDSILKSMDIIEKNIEYENVTLTDNVADVNKFVTMIDYTENNTDVYENTNNNIEKNIEDESVTISDNLTDVNKSVTMIDHTESYTDVCENTNILLKNTKSVLSDEDRSSVTYTNKRDTMIHNIENGTATYKNKRTLSKDHNTITVPAQSKKENTSAINLPVISSNVVESEKNILSLMCLEEIHLSDESIGSRDEESTEVIATQQKEQGEHMENSGIGDGKQMTLSKKKQIVKKTNKSSKNKTGCIDKCLTKTHNVSEISKIKKVAESDKGNNKTIRCENKRFSKFKYDDYTVIIRDDQKVTVINDSNNIPIINGEINSSICYTETRPQSNKSTVKDIKSDNKGAIDCAPLALDTNYTYEVKSNTESNTKLNKTQNKHIKGVQELVVHRVTAEGASNFKINLPNLCDETGVQIPIHLIEKTSQNTSTSSIEKRNKAIKSNRRNTKTKKKPTRLIKKGANKSLSSQVLLETILMDHCYCFNSRHMLLELKMQSKSNEAMKNNLRFKIVQKDTGKIRFIKTASKLNTVEKLIRSRYVQNIIDDFEKEEADTSIVHGLDNEITYTGIEKNMCQGVSSIPRGKSYDNNLNPMEEANDYAILTDIKVEVYDPKPAECNNENDDSFDWCVQRWEKETERINTRPDTSINKGCTTTDKNSATDSVGSITDTAEYFRKDNDSDEEYGNSYLSESDSNYNYYHIKPSECENYYEPRSYENDNYEVQPCKETTSNYPADSTDFEMNNITVTFSSSLFDDDLKNTSAEFGDELANDQSTEANMFSSEMRNISPDLLEPLYFEPWEDSTFDHAVSNSQNESSGSTRNKECNEHEKKLENQRAHYENQSEVPHPPKKKRKQSDIKDEKTAQYKSHKVLLGSISKRLKQNLTECIDKNKDLNINCDKLLQLPIVLLNKISVDELRDKKGRGEMNVHDMLKEPLHKNISTNTITDLVEANKELTDDPEKTNGVDGWLSLTDSNTVIETNSNELWGSWATITNVKYFNKDTTSSTKIETKPRRSKSAIKVRQWNSCQNKNRDQIAKAATDHFNAMKKLKKCRTGSQNLLKFNDIFTLRFLQDGELEHVRKKASYEQEYKHAHSKCVTCILKCPYERHFARYHEENAGDFVCEICECRFKDEIQFIKHTESHKSVYRCRWCSEEYLFFNVLLSHVKLVHSENRKLYTCKVCQKTYFNHVSLWTHQKIHKQPKTKNTKYVTGSTADNPRATAERLNLTDNNLKLTGHNLKLAGDNLKLTGDNLKLTGDNLNLPDNNLKLTDNNSGSLRNNVNLTKKRSRTYSDDKLGKRKTRPIRRRTDTSKLQTEECQRKTFMCLRCNRRYKTSDSWWKHRMMFHKIGTTTEKTNKTDNSLSLTDNNKNLNQERLILTGNNSKVTDNSKPEPVTGISAANYKPVIFGKIKPKRRLHVCKICRKRCKTAGSLAQHKRHVHNDKNTVNKTNLTETGPNLASDNLILAGDSLSLAADNLSVANDSLSLAADNLSLANDNSSLTNNNFSLSENNLKVTENVTQYHSEIEDLNENAHIEINPNRTVEVTNVSPVKVEQERSLYECAMCHKKCKTRHSLALHQKFIHNKTIHKCTIYHKICKTHAALVGHQKYYHNKRNTDKYTKLTETELGLSDNNLNLTDNNLSLTDNNLSLTDNNLSLTKYDTQCDPQSERFNESSSTAEINPNITNEVIQASVEVKRKGSLYECATCHKKCKTRHSLALHQKFIHNKRNTDKYTKLTETELGLSDNNLNLTDNNLSVTDTNLSLTKYDTQCDPQSERFNESSTAEVNPNVTDEVIQASVEVKRKRSLYECATCHKKCKTRHSLALHQKFIHNKRNTDKYTKLTETELGISDNNLNLTDNNLSVTDNNLNLTDNSLSLTKYDTQCDPQSERLIESSSTAEINPNVTDEVIQPSVEVKQGRSLYECAICHKKCITRRSLALHQKFIHNKTIHKCTICHKICKTHAALVRHQKYYHNERNTDKNTKITETELGLSDNNLNLTDNNLCLTDNSLSLTKYDTQCDPQSERFNDSYTAKVNPNVTNEVIQPSVAVKGKRKFRCPVCQKRYKGRKGLQIHIRHKHHTEDTLETTSLTDISSSFCNLSLSYKDLSSTEHNFSLTGNNLGLTDNNLGLPKNYLSLTINKLSLRDSNLSLANDNVRLTESNVALTENNLSLTEEKSSLSHNHTMLIDHTLSLNENNLSYLENNSNLTSDVLRDDKLGLMDNNLNLTENNLNLTGSKVNLTENTSTLTDNTFNYTDNDLNLTDNFSIKDSTVILTDNNLSSKDSNLMLTDNDLSLIDNNFTLKENKLSLRDNYIRLIEKNLSAMNNHLNMTKYKMSLPGIMLNSTDDNMSLTGDNLRETDNNSSLDEKNMILNNKLNSTDNNLSLPENNLRATDNNLNIAENNKSLTEKLNSTDNNYSLTGNNLSSNDNNLYIVKNNMSLTDNKFSSPGNKLNLTDCSYSSTETEALNLSATDYNLSLTENNISLTDNKLNSTDSRNSTDNKMNSTDNNYNSTEINLSATDNNLVILQLSLPENNISLTNKFSSTCNEFNLTDNNYSLTENNLSAIEYNLSLSENNMSLTDNKSSVTYTELNLSYDSLTENNFSATENNLSLTQNNTDTQQLTDKFSSTGNVLYLTDNNYSLTDTNMSLTDNLSSMGNVLYITDNNYSLTENNLSLTENNMSSTDNKSSSTCNEINLIDNNCSLTENNLSSTENYIVLTDRHLNITEKNMSLENELNSSDNNLSLTENNVSATTISNFSVIGDNLSCTDNNLSPTLQNEYKCSVCGVSFSTVFTCRRHIASEHASSLKEHFFDIYLTEVKKGDGS